MSELLDLAEAQWRSVADLTPTMLLKCDREERYVFANRAYAQHRSVSQKDMIGRTVREITGEEAYKRIKPYIQRVLAGETVKFETAVPYPELGLRTVSVSYVPEFDASGQVQGWVSAITDVTDVRQARSELDAIRSKQAAELAVLHRKMEAQARLFDATLSHLSDLIYTFDHEGRLIYANKTLLHLWGRTMPEVVGKRFIDMNYPDGLGEKLHSQVLQVVTTGKPIVGETHFRDAAGKEDLHEYVFNPVFNEEGTVVAMAGTTRLITDRRRADAAYRQLAAIVEFSDDAIVSKNLESIVLSWNAGAERLFGYTAGEIIGKSVTLLIPEDRHDEEPAILARISQGVPIEHYETLRQRKDGSLVEVSLSVSPIKDALGKVIGVSKIARDITEQKRIEKTLKEARDAAEAANEAKDQFLAVLSHELRTPLTPALMTVTALQRNDDLPREILADMQMIQRNIELETKLIDDLLDLSRVTSGKMRLRVEAIHVNEAIEHVCEICRPQILEKGLHLHREFDESAGRVNVDPARLQQVLWNVLKNAAKFSAEGGDIFVSTRKLDSERVAVTVRDTGVGIEPGDLPRIFIAFEQGNSRITRQFGGLGLGLAISKALVELHGGSIHAESEGPGKGSSFVIDLPSAGVANLPLTTPTAHLKNSFSGSLRLLIVEDHADTAHMLARLLQISGHTVKTAGDVATALKFAAEEPFDLLISDVGLPDATGYELMQKIRQICDIRGIAMSGYGMDEDIRKSAAAGFSEHLVKPVDVTVLEHTIRRVMDSPPQ